MQQQRTKQEQHYSEAAVARVRQHAALDRMRMLEDTQPVVTPDCVIRQVRMEDRSLLAGEGRQITRTA